MHEGLTKSPQELHDLFYKLQNRNDLAELLELTVGQLNYYLYVLPSDKKYKVFSVSKKSGELRQISAPASPIKVIQRNLKQILEAVYFPKPSTHGFVNERSIVTNAQLHRKRRYVLNIDLKDFFPSIHFGRVRGLFMSTPYNLNSEIATILAQISCHQGILPQGAPTSPIISNMICARLDAKLQQLAKEYQCTYSRYADDITFSTNRSKFPVALAHLSEIGQVVLGDKLTLQVLLNGFVINNEKVRLQIRQQRQEVTGLTVNKYPNVKRKYIRQIRAILHAWEKYTPESTAENYFNKHSGGKYSDPKSYRPSFPRVVLGKIQFVGMVKGKSNPVYLSLLRKFSRLAPDYIKTESIATLFNSALVRPFIYTEGKTDRKHLLAALKFFKSQGLYTNLDFEFPQGENDEGDTQLLQKVKVVEAQPEPHSRPHIFIFDRDNPKILKELRANDSYMAWKNNVYSVVLPMPKNREGLSGICIELYYKDGDLMRRDEKGRRLYLSNEFRPKTGRHLTENLTCKRFDRLGGELKVIDDLVLDDSEDNANVALSKNEFANNLVNNHPNFIDVDYSGFKPLFERILMIVSDFDSENR